jgi:hypothetical protein
MDSRGLSLALVLQTCPRRPRSRIWSLMRRPDGLSRIRSAGSRTGYASASSDGSSRDRHQSLSCSQHVPSSMCASRRSDLTGAPRSRINAALRRGPIFEARAPWKSINPARQRNRAANPSVPRRVTSSIAPGPPPRRRHRKQKSPAWSEPIEPRRQWMSCARAYDDDIDRIKGGLCTDKSIGQSVECNRFRRFS